MKVSSTLHSGRPEPFLMWRCAEKSRKIWVGTPQHLQSNFSHPEPNNDVQVSSNHKIGSWKWAHHIILDVQSYSWCEVVLKSSWKSQHRNTYNPILVDLSQLMTSQSAQIIKFAATSVSSFILDVQCYFDVKWCWKVAENPALSIEIPTTQF